MVKECHMNLLLNCTHIVSPVRGGGGGGGCRGGGSDGRTRLSIARITHTIWPIKTPVKHRLSMTRAGGTHSTTACTTVVNRKSRAKCATAEGALRALLIRLPVVRSHRRFHQL